MSLQKQFVTRARLRVLFRLHRIQQRALQGEFSTRVLRENTPDPSNRQPAGTVSQLVGYYNEKGAQVGMAHQYVLPDGSLGASGKPDPKCLRVGSILYVVSAKRIK
jgi:hypothetical protein